jgi:hypothetical protein
LICLPSSPQKRSLTANDISREAKLAVGDPIIKRPT